MIKENPLHTAQVEGHESKPNVSPTINALINLLATAHYRKLILEKNKTGYKIDFVRIINGEHHDLDNNSYPRFHIELVMSTQTPQLEITSFHIDRSPHKTHIDYSRKNDEVNRLIKTLEEKEGSAMRDELLCLFGFELLFGNAREINRLKGETQEERFGQLLRDRRRKPLQGKNRRRWIAKKNGDKPCIRDPSYA